MSKGMLCNNGEEVLAGNHKVNPEFDDLGPDITEGWAVKQKVFKVAFLLSITARKLTNI